MNLIKLLFNENELLQKVGNIFGRESFKSSSSKLRNAVALMIMLVATVGATFAQSRTVTGTVTDENGAPLPGATVMVQGSTRGVITDVDGSYSIQAAPADKLTFDYLGVVPQTVEVGSQATVSVSLTSQTTEMDAVSVVAFGKQKKESVISSISTVSPSELQVPSSNLTTAFAGRIAGLISYQTSGEPGANSADFFVRGITTFGTGKVDPLILIDNIELSSDDLSRLSPDDIESFSILKDAAATSLYGSRGANGVIMVKTKEGREGPTRVSARIETSISEATDMVDIADPLTFMKLHNEAVSTRDPLATTPYSDRDIYMREKGVNDYVYPTVDWYDMMFKDYSINTRANINLSGGGQVSQYYVALQYGRENGNFAVDPINEFNSNITLDRYLVRSNININLSKTTKLGVRFSGTFDDYNGPINGGTKTYNRAINANPVLFPAYYAPDLANQYTSHVLFGNSTNNGGDGNYLNPYADMVRGYKDYQKTTVLMQLELSQDLKMITDGLKARIMFNTTRNSYFDMVRTYNPFYYEVASYDSMADEYVLQALNPDKGTDYLSYNSGDGSRTVSSTTYLETALSYNREFNDVHAVSGMFVWTAREQLDAEASSLENSLPTRNLGLAGRFTYGYDSRYFLEANFGYNGSERFAENNRWGFFPSGGLGWIVSNESFWADSKMGEILPMFKFKATYGLVGNDAISSDRFFYLSQVNMNNGGKGYTFGDDFGYGLNGISISRYADDDITWEVSRKLNLGLEMNFFDKLEIQADYFSEVRTKILQERADIPTVMGLQAKPKSNIGEARGHGFEVSMNYQHILSDKAWINIMGNFTYAASRFTIYEEPDYSSTAPWLSHDEQKIKQEWGLIAERLFIDDYDVKNAPVQQFGEYMAGDIKYTDINNDGVINKLDFVPIGFPKSPEVIYGFGASAGYGDFDASFFFQGSARSSFWVDPGSISPFVNKGDGGAGNNAVLQVIADSHWSENDQDPYAFWPRLSDQVIENNTQKSTWFMRSGDFLRLKSVEVGYTLPYELTSKARIQKLRFYVSGTNLFVLSDFDLWDVEMGGNGLGYPVQRVYNIGLQIGF